MFPGAGAEIIRNEVGEPLGWDYPSRDDPYDPNDDIYGDDYPDTDFCGDCGEDVEDCVCDQDDSDLDAYDGDAFNGGRGEPIPRTAPDVHLEAAYEERFETDGG